MAGYLSVPPWDRQARSNKTLCSGQSGLFLSGWVARNLRTNRYGKNRRADSTLILIRQVLTGRYRKSNALPWQHRQAGCGRDSNR